MSVVFVEVMGQLAIKMLFTCIGAVSTALQEHGGSSGDLQPGRLCNFGHMDCKDHVLFH